MGTKPIWMPDTSAVNRLADDPASEALIAGLGAAYFVRFPFTVVSEIIANASGNRRKTLLRVCRRLLAASGDCIEPSHEIIRMMVAQFEKGLPTNILVYVRMREAEIEILREVEFSDDLSSQERNENREHDKQFAGLFADAKAAFDSAGVTRPTSLSELIEHLQKGGAFWKLVQNLYNRVASKPTAEATAKKFYEVCEPFRALVIAVFAAQYARCFPAPGELSMKTGRNDTFMAASLPYCDEFITDDQPQLRAYRAVAKYMGLNVTIRTFDEFAESFAIMGIPKATPPNQPTQLSDEDRKLRWELYGEHKKQIWQDIQSSTDSYDQSLLTLSSGGLGLSIAFIKDIVPLNHAVWLSLLYASWALFGLTILATVASFQFSVKALNKNLEFLWKFYIDADDSFRDKESRYSEALRWCTVLAGTFFFGAIVCTAVFATKNISRAKMSDPTKAMLEGRFPQSMTPLPKTDSDLDQQKPIAKSPTTKAGATIGPCSSESPTTETPPKP